ALAADPTAECTELLQYIDLVAREPAPESSEHHWFSDDLSVFRISQLTPSIGHVLLEIPTGPLVTGILRLPRIAKSVSDTVAVGADVGVNDERHDNHGSADPEPFSHEM